MWVSRVPLTCNGVDGKIVLDGPIPLSMMVVFELQARGFQERVHLIKST